MKKSGYRSITHIYLIFFSLLVGTILVGIGIFFSLISIQKPDGSTAKSDWPKQFTENFAEQIIFIDGTPQVKQAGLTQLQDYRLWLQIVDEKGARIYGCLEPPNAPVFYSGAELLDLVQARGNREENTTTFLGTAQNNGVDYVYIIHFPLNISKVTMYLNGANFSGGKSVFLVLIGAMFLAVAVMGVGYGYSITKTISHMSTAVRDVAKRRYLPIQNHGTFEDVYSSLNALDTEIRASDQMREQTEKLRREWIANITHDLKTPLSPVRGYAEILADRADTLAPAETKRYADIMLKNLAFLGTLIDDLKLTYQLESGMMPVNREQDNLARFLKELVIDILNRPEYENRTIRFENETEAVAFDFDATLLTRAFCNLIINAFVHGEEKTEITLHIRQEEQQIKILLSDNGKGITSSEVNNLFERYYRGADTEQKPEGTGLGLAITKQIVELHGGSITVSSIQGGGTEFCIAFPTT
ncbi:HAMP domain-containing sensor histidine kinase [Oscillospiraceae bacterium PP1C4]